MKNSLPLAFDPWTVQPVVIRYTDYVVLVPSDDPVSNIFMIYVGRNEFVNEGNS
jgi:hypothetical protein